jgi:SAM-dependent methyltransferase
MTYDSDQVEAHFRNKFKEFGEEDARGVDWNSTGQRLRFEILWEEMRNIRCNSILDAGCGTGAFLDFLKSEKDWRGTYRGFDLVDEMLEAGQRRHPEASFFKADVLSMRDTPVSDVVVCSGLFAFMPEEVVCSSLDILWARARNALIFNSFSNWSPIGGRDDSVLFHDPLALLAHGRKLARFVRIRHDYFPSDFTITLLKGRYWEGEAFSW